MGVFRGRLFLLREDRSVIGLGRKFFYRVIFRFSFRVGIRGVFCRFFWGRYGIVFRVFYVITL